MGTDYSTSAGYGFGWGKSETPTSLIPFLKPGADLEFLEEDALAHRYPHLLVFSVGAFNYGEAHVTVVAKSTYQSWERHEAGRYDLSTPPTGVELQELVQAHADLHLSHQANPIGWWVGVDLG